MINAVIFDMDGVLIDSEWMWSEAERNVFSSLGVDVNDDLSAETASMSTKEVTEFWYQRNPWSGLSLAEVENTVIDYVGKLIGEQGKPIPGVQEILNFFYIKGIKIGLATNSPSRLIDVVLKRLNIANFFDATSSVDEGDYPKPHPQVYLNTAKKLGCSPVNCLVFEDSLTGILAAKSASMMVIAVAGEKRLSDDLTQYADLNLKRLNEFDSGHLESLSYRLQGRC